MGNKTLSGSTTGSIGVVKLVDEKTADEISEHCILEIIREWKHGWMNQRQNSEADYQNYFNRAFGVDANMQHSLAKRIHEHFLAHRDAEISKLNRDVNMLIQERGKLYQENAAFREILLKWLDEKSIGNDSAVTRFLQLLQKYPAKQGV